MLEPAADCDIRASKFWHFQDPGQRDAFGILAKVSPSSPGKEPQ